MHLEDEILKEHSREQCNTIVQWVGKSQQRFDELFALFLRGEYRITQRASWPLSYCVEAHPEFIKNHFENLLNNLQRPGVHDAVKRNTIRLLQYADIPEKFRGRVMDMCFKSVASPTEAVAIKAFSLTVLGNLAKLYPEILPEIKLLVREQLPYQTAAFKSRAKPFLQQ
ncbi:MAG: hypothetical protein JWR61_2514 [Ferruginibacter sp.]|uniref:hypothetical protein n=1 Tax=Ferruginibacter sp. TaxID=1940288 RepID=UPI00265958C7|nr:hypothetical protein [Ferruginibacter sp.]MDB5277559.1 hypothetical protein [Ferruginibacter sp.]